MTVAHSRSSIRGQKPKARRHHRVACGHLGDASATPRLGNRGQLRKSLILSYHGDQSTATCALDTNALSSEARRPLRRSHERDTVQMHCNCVESTGSEGRASFTKLVTALQLAAHQTATVARDEAMKPTGRTRSTGTQAQKKVQAAGAKHRRGHACGSPAKHTVHP